MAEAGAPPRSTRTAARAGGAGRRRTAAWPWRLWLRVGLLVAGVLVGLPLAHALLGEVAALLGGAVLFGFLLGRWTAPRSGSIRR